MEYVSSIADRVFIAIHAEELQYKMIPSTRCITIVLLLFIRKIGGEPNFHYYPFFVDGQIQNVG
jgi:hypothetical protein